MSLIERIRANTVDLEGSTRLLALVRIGLVCLLWSRWGQEMRFPVSSDPERLVLGWSFYGSSTLVLVGLWTRPATVWLGLTMVSIVAWFGGVRGVEPWTHHHTTLLVIATALLVTTPCGRSLSVDRLLAVRRERAGGPKAPAERAPLWGMRLLALQVTAVYLYGGLDKLTWPFLNGERMTGYFLAYVWQSDMPDGAWVAPAMTLLGASTVALELALVPWLWSRRWQLWGMAAGVVFHGALYYLLPVGTFTATMVLLYLCFLHPEDVDPVTG